MSTDEVEIVPYQDGPYLVRGPAALRDQDGRGILTGRRTIALCRCGKSRMRPFCDGTHQLIRFKAPSGPERKRRVDSDPESAATAAKAIGPASRCNGTIRKGLEDAVAHAAVQVGEPGGSDDAIAHAVSLLSAARAVLASTTRATDREVPKVIEQLSVLVAQLEAQGGRA